MRGRKQHFTGAEHKGLNCKYADVFIAGPETNERARDGPASLWELIEVAANMAHLHCLTEICFAATLLNLEILDLSDKVEFTSAYTGYSLANATCNNRCYAI